MTESIASSSHLAALDRTGGTARIAHSSNGRPLGPQHRGPVRLLVSHLHFWKSATWVRGVEQDNEDKPGSWDWHGYHNDGDPWQEKRYSGD